MSHIRTLSLHSQKKPAVLCVWRLVATGLYSQLHNLHNYPRLTLVGFLEYPTYPVGLCNTVYLKWCEWNKAYKLYCYSSYGVLTWSLVSFAHWNENVNFIFLIRVYLILCNCYRKATQEHGLNREVVNVLGQFIDATPSEIEVVYLLIRFLSQ